MPVTLLNRMCKGNKGRYIIQDSKGGAVLANGASGLAGISADKNEPQFALGRTPVRQQTNDSSSRRGARWFAKGPVHLDRAVRAASKGAAAVVVWLAVRAREDGAAGKAATTAWIAEATGLNIRTIQTAVAALVEIGMLKRSGRQISIPSYAKGAPP